MCLFLFELPLLWLYLKLRPAAKRATVTIAPTTRGEAAFPLFSLILSVTFILLATTSNTFYLWYGNEENLRRLSAMPLAEFVIYKTAIMGGYLIGSLLLILLAVTKRRFRFLVEISCLLCIGIFFVRQMTNSRSLSLMTIALLLGVPHVLASGRALPPKWRVRWWHVLAGTLIGYYSFAVVTNFRIFYPREGTFSLGMLNPLQRVEEDLNPNREVWMRLNGIDLIARIRLGSEGQFLALGEAWRIPAYVIAWQMFDREGVSEYKNSFQASPKRYLMLRYTDLKYVDYPSCLLTDVYGNFGFLGFPFAALLISWMLARVSVWLYQPASASQVVMAIVFIMLLLQFESEFINIIVGWVRLVPLLCFVFALRPFRVVKRVPGAGVQLEGVRSQPTWVLSNSSA
jgi:hypothetical protein